MSAIFAMCETVNGQGSKESWGTRAGVILAVAGSAVGLGNFLRFPGLAAQYGGGAFMIAYFTALVLLGLPICWAEWTMGRMGGRSGFNSCPGIMGAIGRHPVWRYLGVIGVVIPVVIYMYYVAIEAWCLGYAVSFWRGAMKFSDVVESNEFWGKYIGIGADGAALGLGLDQLGGFLAFAFVLNFFLIYRGIAKGIEWFCNYAMPTLVVLAVVILVRVLTLGTPDPSQPHNSVLNGLGFMWNPSKHVVEMRDDAGHWPPLEAAEEIPLSAVPLAKADAEASGGTQRVREVTLWDQLRKPQLWLAAAGQIFFSLSVGFGVIITYSSYLKRKDDVVLSGLSASSANEFAEVALGGLITIPAAVAFLGVAGVAGMASTFGLGFNVLPLVFAQMPFGGAFFGGLFFFLLFLAAITSSLSMLQPGIAFVEETLGVGRRVSVALLGFVTAVGCGFVVYFSKDLKALDTLDFWVGNVLIYLLATLQIVLFAWVLGVDRGFAAAHEGASIRIPGVFRFIMKWVSPAFLLAVFGFWLVIDVFGMRFGDSQPAQPSAYITDLFGRKPNQVALLAVSLIGLVGVLFLLFAALARSYRNAPGDAGAAQNEEDAR